MDRQAALDRLDSVEVALLATVRPDGAPHLVPVTFVRRGGQVFTAVDHKPKSTTRLQRLLNIEAEPRVSLLAHNYHTDWNRLWWVRADGRAVVEEAGAGEAVAALVQKYAQYQSAPPTGPVIAITLDQVIGWAATDHI